MKDCHCQCHNEPFFTHCHCARCHLPRWLRLQAADQEGHGMSEAQWWMNHNDERCFVGWLPRECADHRTVGEHRAWCYDCTEWCYSADEEMACKGCRIPMLEARVRELTA